MAPILQMRKIEKRFTGVHALKGVDFEVSAGEVVALLGENGAGKSTLMKVLGGVHQPDSGEVLIDGAPGAIEKVSPSAGFAICRAHSRLPVSVLNAIRYPSALPRTTRPSFSAMPRLR